MLYPSKRGIKIAIYWKLFLELLVSHILLVLKLKGIKNPPLQKESGCNLKDRGDFFLIEIMTLIVKCIPKTMKALPLFHPYGSLSVPV
jgi:hypothetical protein